MNGQTMSYKEMLDKTPYPQVSPNVFNVQIDYHGLRAYARSKNIPIAELSNQEKNKFIVNSSMEQITAMN